MMIQKENVHVTLYMSGEKLSTITCSLKYSMYAVEVILFYCAVFHTHVSHNCYICYTCQSTLALELQYKIIILYTHIIV